MLRYVAMAVLAAGLLTGCVSVRYEGDSYPATEEVKLFEDRSLIPENYVTIGKCLAYGRYDTFSKNQICEKVRSKAENTGADAVYIYAYQVIPESVITGGGDRVWDDGTSNTEWYRLEQDFSSYGQIGKDPKSTHARSSYMRVVRAEFLKDPANGGVPVSTVSGNLNRITPDPKPSAVSKPAPAEEKSAEPEAEKPEAEKAEATAPAAVKEPEAGTPAEK